MHQKTIPPSNIPNMPITPKTPINNPPLPPQVQQIGNGNYTHPSHLPPQQQHTQPHISSLSTDGKILTKQKLQDLARFVDGLNRLDDESYELILQIADEFIESVTNFGCKLAKHRKSLQLEAKDILFHLEKSWDLHIPGFSEEVKPKKKRTLSESHKQKLEIVKRMKRSI